jgi:hypothetical protein
MSRSPVENSAEEIVSDIHHLFDQPQTAVVAIENNDEIRLDESTAINIGNDEESIHSTEYPESNVANENKHPGIFHLTPDEMLRLAANAFCDGPWASVSALSINASGKKTDAFWPTTGAEVAYGIPAPFILSIAATCLSEKISPQKAFASFIALAVAMIAWNLGQYYGEQYFGKLGMTDKNAGYAASLWTGPAEGAVQAFLYDAILAALGDKETKTNYQQFNDNATRAALFFFNYFLTSSLSGMVWQVIYNAIFPNCTNTPTDCTDPAIKNIVFVGFAVALGAALTSYLSGAAFKASTQCLNAFFKAADQSTSELESNLLDLRSAELESQA